MTHGLPPASFLLSRIEARVPDHAGLDATPNHANRDLPVRTGSHSGSGQAFFHPRSPQVTTLYHLCQRASGR